MTTKPTLLSNNDWLAQLTFQLGLTPMPTFVILAVFNTLFSVLLAFLFNAWQPSQGSGLAAEPAAWFYIIVVQPAAVAYYVWMQHAGTRIFTTLKKGRVVETSGGLEQELANCQSRYESSKARHVALFLAILVVIWFNLAANNLVFSFGSSSWLVAHPAIILISSPILFVVYYALILVVYDIAVITAALRSLFKKNQIRVEPLHPDGAGGFGTIGRFAANLGFGIAILGFALAASIMQAPTAFYLDYALVVNIFLYMMFAPALFLMPIWSGHRAMVGYRDRLGLEISDEFRDGFAELRSNRKENYEIMQPALRRVQQLVEMRGLVADFPIWPFNSGSLRKYVGLVVSPVVPVAISLFTNVFFGFPTP